MSFSFPSKRVTVLDVPDVSGFKAQFFYNFFVPDESVNDTGDYPDATIETRAPRYVKFTFNCVTLHQGSLLGNEFVQRTSVRQRSEDISIADNITQVQTEAEFSSHEFLGFEFQDNNVDKKLYTLVSGSIAKRTASNNRFVSSSIDDQRNTLIDALHDEHSLLDAAKALCDSVSSNIEKNIIVDALAQIDALNLSLIDDATQKKLTTDVYERVKDVSIKGQISNRLAGRIIKNIVNDPMSTFSDEFAGSQRRAMSIQLRARARFNPNVIAREEFDPEFKSISYAAIDSNDVAPESRVMGYIIEKLEVLQNGKLKQHAPIIIQNPEATVAYDENIAYGKTYVYSIKTIVELRTTATIDDSDNVVIASGLVSSRKSKRSFVQCIEAVPPPPPADFNILWDYTHDAPFITWSFPTNRQRDIKKFQIFKRKSINEPFQLIKQYDFDNSIVKYESGETPEKHLIEYSTEPTTTYVDRQFKKTDRAIYALCSIDAHGYSSNYSMQIEIAFDAYKNNVKKKIVSYSGAPKSYPNMSLNTDLFVDTIKTSGFSRVKVYFDPEFLRVNDVKGNDLRLLTRNNVDGGKYVAQFINTDIMQSETVDIKINDLRSSTERDE